MRIRSRSLLVLVALTAVALAAETSIVTALQTPAVPTQAPAPVRRPDVIFVPTAQAVADAMLKMASVTKNDVVYDLGCGDGRLVITAARTYGVRAVGIDIDPQRIAEANANAKTAGVTDRVQFMVGDIFDPAVKFDEATVVTLYLLTDLNIKLRPRLWAELRPGTRIVSNSFSMGDWMPEQTQQVENYTIYFWTIPKRGATNLQPISLLAAPAF